MCRCPRPSGRIWRVLRRKFCELLQSGVIVSARSSCPGRTVTTQRRPRAAQHTWNRHGVESTLLAEGGKEAPALSEDRERRRLFGPSGFPRAPCVLSKSTDAPGIGGVGVSLPVRIGGMVLPRTARCFSPRGGLFHPRGHQARDALTPVVRMRGVVAADQTATVHHRCMETHPGRGRSRSWAHRTTGEWQFRLDHPCSSTGCAPHARTLLGAWGKHLSRRFEESQKEPRRPQRGRRGSRSGGSPRLTCGRRTLQPGGRPA